MSNIVAFIKSPIGVGIVAHASITIAHTAVLLAVAKPVRSRERHLEKQTTEVTVESIEE